MKHKLRFVIMATIGLIGAAVLVRAIGINRIIKVSKPLAINETAEPVLVYDSVKVAKLNSLMASMDFNREYCFYSGSLNITDGRDSSGSVHDVKFLYSKMGKQVYYHFGETETINNNGLNVFVDNGNKKIAVSSQQFEATPPVKTTAFVIAQLRAEKYAFGSSVTGQSKKLTLINEHHVSCKELSVTYDTVSNKLQRIFTRLTDITDVMNKTKERKVEIRIEKAEKVARPGAYPDIADVLTKVNGAWALTPKYANYELIIL